MGIQSPDRTRQLRIALYRNSRRTLIFVAGRDPLWDEGIEYANRLARAAVPATLHVYKGVPHDFAHYEEVQSTQRFLEDFASGLQAWLA